MKNEIMENVTNAAKFVGKRAMKHSANLGKIALATFVGGFMTKIVREVSKAEYEEIAMDYKATKRTVKEFKEEHFNKEEIIEEEI